MESEKNLYQKAKAVAIAHKGAKSYQTVNAFLVGYYDLLETDNGDITEFRSDYVYSEKWYLKGKPAKVELDYPVILMLPPASSGTTKKGDSARTYKITLVVVDLMYQDRDGNDKTAAAKRSKEEVWADCARIAEEYVKELTRLVPGGSDNILMLGGFDMERYYQKNTDKVAGVEVSFNVRINYCYTGEFDYEKEYPAKC